MKKSNLQRTIAISVMFSGMMLGLWISSGRGNVVSAQQPDPSLPPPSMDLPPDMMLQMPPAPPPQNMQTLPGPTQDFDDHQSEQGLELEVPQEFNYTTVNPEGFMYAPEGLRDPFFPVFKDKAGQIVEPQNTKTTAEMDFNPQDPLQAFMLAEYRLAGVMWDVQEPRAMVLTPDGRLFTVKRKIRLGREGAVIAAIRESEIVVAEPNPDGTYVNASTRVITMKR